MNKLHYLSFYFLFSLWVCNDVRAAGADTEEADRSRSTQLTKLSENKAHNEDIPPLLLLSNELLEKVISFKGVGKKVYPVCQRLREIVQGAPCFTFAPRHRDIDLEILSRLSHVHTLNLCFSRGVRDVSALGHVHTLTLSYTGVKDVSGLGNVHTLNLSHTGVTDVSALGNVHNLNLVRTRITDVSALSNVRELDLSYAWVTDISALANVKRLIISGCNVSDENIAELRRINPEIIIKR